MNFLFGVDWVFIWLFKRLFSAGTRNSAKSEWNQFIHEIIFFAAWESAFLFAQNAIIGLMISHCNILNHV